MPTRKRVPLTTVQRVDIVNAFSVDLVPVADLAARYGLTRAGIYKVLHRMGVVTPKVSAMPVSCTVCGSEIVRTRARIRRQLNHFCSTDCYHAFLEAGNGNLPYIQSRYGQMVARRLVAGYFALQDGHIVHHENRNSNDNRLENLRVFRNQGDHVRHHRGFEVTPIWDGRNA